MKRTFLLTAGLLALFTLNGQAHAQTTNRAAAAGAETRAVPTDDFSEGEIRKLDMETGAVTLRHGPIKSLDMSAMTMVFKAKDKAMLNTLKPGDKVRFKAVSEEGRLWLAEIQLIQ